MSKTARVAGVGISAAALSLAMVAGPASAAPAQDDKTPMAPLSMAQSGGVENSYVVMLKKPAAGAKTSMATTAKSAASSARSVGAKVSNEYTTIGGYSATMTADQLAKVRQDPRVAFVSQNTMMKASDVTSWGLDRIDQRDLPLDSSYSVQGGEGVTAYIIDTGINLEHKEFEGRLKPGFDSVDKGGDANDCQGHGSHVAGTVGGATYGVANKVNLVPVRVLNCEGSGSSAGVIEGMDWVAQNAQGPSVANMSLGGSADDATDEAVKRMTGAGVSTVVAAGNETSDACGSSPARAPEAVTVGATNDQDDLADFSNYGDCVDINAPGQDITSAWKDGADASNTISGTSMASPHTAGAAALLLGKDANLNPQQVSDALVEKGTNDKISDPKGSPNELLFVGE